MLNQAIESLVIRAQRWKISRQFRASMGHDGDFEHPTTHQEKVQFRKLYGNHRFYAMVADKYKARAYVASKVGEHHLIPSLGVYDRLDASVFEALPQRFIIKANHGCKWHQVVHDKSTLDVGRTVRRFNKLLRKRYGGVAGERHYNYIQPRIVIEELLHDDHGGLPWDYSFFCYHGPKGFDYTYSVCAPEGRNASFATNGELMSCTLSDQERALHANPANFDELLRVARSISADFDFVRADLYSVGGRVYFGELTCTPHQGYGQFKSELQKRLRNEMWHLDHTNPLLYVQPALSRPVSPVGSRRFHKA